MPDHDDEERRALEELDTLRLIPIYDEDTVDLGGDDTVDESAAGDRPASQPLPDRFSDRDAVISWPNGAQQLALARLS